MSSEFSIRHKNGVWLVRELEPGEVEQKLDVGQMILDGAIRISGASPRRLIASENILRMACRKLVFEAASAKSEQTIEFMKERIGGAGRNRTGA